MHMVAAEQNDSEDTYWTQTKWQIGHKQNDRLDTYWTQTKWQTGHRQNDRLDINKMTDWTLTGNKHNDRLDTYCIERLIKNITWRTKKEVLMPMFCFVFTNTSPKLLLRSLLILISVNILWRLFVYSYPHVY